jgi:hypothetical protein
LPVLPRIKLYIVGSEHTPIQYSFIPENGPKRHGRRENLLMYTISTAKTHMIMINMITDINQDVLGNELSEIAGVKYLSHATKEDADKFITRGEGFIYGRNNRLMFPCVVTYRNFYTYRDISRWVFFLIGTGTPRTYLSLEVSIIALLFTVTGP